MIGSTVLVWIFLILLWILIDFTYPTKNKKLKKGNLKCKLLRKIHKRYSIYWYPDGGFLWNERYGAYYSVEGMNYFADNIFTVKANGTKEKALQAAKDSILKDIKRNYQAVIKTNKFRKPIKVWH